MQLTGYFPNKNGPNRKMRRRHLSTAHANNRVTTPGRMRQVIPLHNGSVKVLIHRRVTA